MYTKEVGLRDFYNLYKQTCKEKNFKIHDYKLFTSIIKDCNTLIRDKIIFNNDKLKMPYRLGELSVRKFENRFDPEKQYKWRVDYKKSKELGQIVYYGEQYGYRWKWDRSKAVVSGRLYYHFKPVRQASRLICKAIKEYNIDYFAY